MKLVIFCHILALFFASTAFAYKAVKRPSTLKKKPGIYYVLKAKSVKKTGHKLTKSQKKKLALKKRLKARGYEIAKIPTWDIPPLLTREDLNKIVPKDIAATAPADEVLKKMGDKAVQVWLKSSTAQNFAVVQSAQKMEKAMKAEVAFGDAQEEGVQHKLNFQVQAVQATSKIDYTGYVNATVSYNARDQKTGIEFREKLFRDKDFYVNHSTTKSEDLSSVGMQWSF